MKKADLQVRIAQLERIRNDAYEHGEPIRNRLVELGWPESGDWTHAPYWRKSVATGRPHNMDYEVFVDKRAVVVKSYASASTTGMVEPLGMTIRPDRVVWEFPSTGAAQLAGQLMKAICEFASAYRFNEAWEAIHQDIYPPRQDDDEEYD